MADEVVYEIAMLNSDDPTIKKNLDVAQKYLTDSKGMSLAMNQDHFEKLRKLVFSRTEDKIFTNNDLAVLNATGFSMLHTDIQASTYAIQQEVRAVGNLVAAAHADTIEKLNTLQNGIQQVNQNMLALGENLNQTIQMVLKLQSDFDEYVKKDEMANNVHRADSAIIRLNQELESKFSHNNELRRSAVGILQANDLSIRTDTILTKAEELLIQTPNYWLAPALVVLAQWITASREMASGKGSGDKDVQKSLGNFKAILQEAYLRECIKTSLFFGLICRRANDIAGANQWFMEYMSFQNPKEVDHTCIVLLNAYAAGLMGHGEEETKILSIMKGWLDELMFGGDDEFENQLIQDWKNTCIELYMTAKPPKTQYQALPAFCPETWPTMQAVMREASISRELLAFLDRELSMRDFNEENLTILDSMIADLVTDFDADELPIRRELEYQQLVIDLEGNLEVANGLRSIKDDILTETKSFVSILSDAARSAELSHASTATHVYAIRILMPWIKKAYLEIVDDYRSKAPQTIQIQIADFSTTTVNGENEEQVISDYVAFVNQQEKAELEKSKTGIAQKTCLVLGVIFAVLGIILGLTGMIFGFLLAIAGIAMFGYGLLAATKAKKAQQHIQEEMAAKRENGVLVIRQVMKEVREWRAEYATSDAQVEETVATLDSLTKSIYEIAD